MQIFTDTEAPYLRGINQFLKPKTMTYLGLIRDIANPIYMVVKLGAAMIQRVFKAVGHRHDTTAVTGMGDNPTKIV